jgi:uroporphyrinogen decarboxylase
MKGEKRAERVQFFEYVVDEAVMRPILEGMGREWVPTAGNAAGWATGTAAGSAAYWDNYIYFWWRMGYPFVQMRVSLPFTVPRLMKGDTAAGADKQRAWTDEHHGPIGSAEEFERYPWPRVGSFDWSACEYVAAHLPEGMGLVINHAGGPLEWTSSLLSYERLCLLLYDEPGLVRAVVERVGGLLEQFYRHARELPGLVAILQGDDMGFRTGTLIAPDDLRRYTLPWHRRLAGLAHERGLLYFLHSCGNLGAIMEDLIGEVGVDGKHSYEEAILPVTEAFRRYGERLAILGGVDIDVLARGSEQQVRAYVQGIVEACGGGRYALGSGNSVPSYVSVGNYLAMMDEGRRWGG